MHNKTDEFSPLTLAFVGDGVYDLLVREYLVRQANRPVGELNKVKVAMVNCRSQAQFAAKLMPHLTEKESTAKNGTVAEYHSATGLECLFGYLHLNGEQARVEELFGLIVGLVFGNDKDMVKYL